MTNETSRSDRVAKVCRFVLLTAIAVVGALIVTAPQSEVGLGKPFMLRSAVAEVGSSGGVCAAPDYLLLTLGTVGNIDKFYIVDTNKQVICVYTATGDKLRLIAARRFDFDAIPDASLSVKTAAGQMQPFEGTNGITRDDAKLYGDGVKAALEQVKK